MKIEAEYYRVGKGIPPELLDCEIVPDNSQKVIDFINPTSAFINRINGTKDCSTIWLRNYKGAVVLKFDSIEDEEGAKVDRSKPIKFSYPQFIAILAPDRQSGLLIFHSDAGHQENSPYLQEDHVGTK